MKTNISEYSYRGSAIAKIVGVNAKNLPQYEGESYMSCGFRTANCIIKTFQQTN